MRDHGASEAAAGARATGPVAAAARHGRVGSWHTYRWLWWLGAAVTALALPWQAVPPGQQLDVLAVVAAVGLAWAVPVWRCGAIADGRGVRVNGVLTRRRYRWESIVGADVEWHQYEPRLLLLLADGDEVCVPGIRMPNHLAYRRDLWRDSDMWTAALLITEVAEQHRPIPPPDGILVPVATRRLRPAPTAA